LKRAVFLDRDGVINRAVVRGGRPYPSASVGELEILPGVAEAVGALRRAGYRVIVATNQPDVATGVQQRAVVEAIHDRVRAELAVDDVRVCHHADPDRCSCRKSKPGMLLAAAADWSLDLARCVMVGDRWRDISAGRAAGCRTILVGDGYGERFADAPDAVAGSLAEASRLILSQEVWGSPDRVPNAAR
jgi:D-glycero-D-manno-heptose 1,7-bisphosphate phosphatase